MLDRIDIQIEVPAVTIADLNKDRAEASAAVAERVSRARQHQQTRYKEFGLSMNAYIQGEMLDDLMPLATDAKELLDKAAEKMRLSARGYFRLIRVARTIADLEGDLGEIKSPHIAESLSYRRINLNY